MLMKITQSCSKHWKLLLAIGAIVHLGSWIGVLQGQQRLERFIQETSVYYVETVVQTPEYWVARCVKPVPPGVDLGIHANHVRWVHANNYNARDYESMWEIKANDPTTQLPTTMKPQTTGLFYHYPQNPTPLLIVSVAALLLGLLGLAIKKTNHERRAIPAPI